MINAGTSTSKSGRCDKGEVSGLFLIGQLKAQKALRQYRIKRETKVNIFSAGRKM